MLKVKISILWVLVMVIVALPLSFYMKKPSEDAIYLARNLVFETLQDSHKRARAGDAQAIQELEAISRVVFARMRAGRGEGFPSSVKGVVCQENQFSWTRNPLGCERHPTNVERYEFMVALAQKHLAGQFRYPWPSENQCLMWYKRSDEVNVSKRSQHWFEKNLIPVAIIGSHRFYCKKAPVKKLQVLQARSSP